MISLNTITRIKSMQAEDTLEGEGLLCCGKSFSFDFTGKSSVKFYGVEGSTILVVYVKDGQMYIAISCNCGMKFSEPLKVAGIEGQITDIQIFEKHHKFVVAFIERKSNQDYKRAISGTINRKDCTLDSRECINPKPKPGVVSIAVNIRKYKPKEGESAAGPNETVDYVFTRVDSTVEVDCQGHGSCKPVP
jgi:hypothetical protein